MTAIKPSLRPFSTPEDPAIGRSLWKQTAFVQPDYPIERARGKFREEGYVYFERQGQQMRRRLVEPKDPKTPRQLPRREAWKQAVDLWSSAELTDAHRASWLDYSLARFWPNCTWYAPRLAGMNGFRRVHVIRLALGMGVLNEAPKTLPPPLALRIVQEPAPDETSFTFRVEHSYEVAPGARLEVEITPAMPTMRRQPEESDYGWACDEPLACHPELKASGALYTITGARHAVAAGKRYGLRVALVTAEGVPGGKLTQVFLKEIAPPEPQATPLLRAAERRQEGPERTANFFCRGRLSICAPLPQVVAQETSTARVARTSTSASLYVADLRAAFSDLAVRATLCPAAVSGRFSWLPLASKCEASDSSSDVVVALATKCWCKGVP